MAQKKTNAIVYGLYDPRNPEEFRYIGKSAHGLKRISDHRYRVRNSKRKTYLDKWWGSLMDAGVEPLHVLLFSRSGVTPEVEAYLGELEILLIAAYRADGHPLTNLTDGGEGKRGHVPTAETRAKQSAATKGRPKSEETKERMREAAAARPPMAEETKAKMSESATNSEKAKTHRKQLAESRIGSTCTEEHKSRVSAALTGIKKGSYKNKGRPLSEAHKEALSKAAQLRKEAKELDEQQTTERCE